MNTEEVRRQTAETSPLARGFSFGSPSVHLAVKVLLLLVLGLVFYSVVRLRLVGGYGVETDFYGGFVPEARHVLAGQPLEMQWQPPFYPILLAAAHTLNGNWFRCGLIISVLSALVALWSAHSLFRNLFGEAMGVAATFLLLLWPDFAVYAVTASSDMPFLALMLLSLAVASGRSRSVVGRGLLSGAIAGLSALTRTNGIVLILLPLFYTVRLSRGQRRSGFIAAVSGFFLPWGLWLIMSACNHSPFFPTHNYVDIATRFYAPTGHRESSDSDNWTYAEKSFASLGEVLMYDPARLVKGVALNLVTHGWHLFRQFSHLLPLVAVISLCSLFSLLWRERRSDLWILMLIFAAQYGVLSLRSFGSRYYLFLIPVVGAGCLSSAEIGFRALSLSNRARAIILGAIVLMCCVYFGRISMSHVARLRRSEARDALAAASIIKQRHITEGGIVARKPHLPFLAGLEGLGFPLVTNLDELKMHMFSESEMPTFLFFGTAEAVYRPDLKFLQSPTSTPSWLVPISHGESGGSVWTLYEVCRSP